MPRPRQKALFELGGQWIGREVGKPSLYRYWHDAGTGHSRRASLGTSDLEAAKTALAEIVVKGAPQDGGSYLSTVLTIHFEQRADHLPSAKPAHAPGAQTSFQLGHKRMRKDGEARTTRAFAEFGSGYLKDAADVLDAWMSRALKIAARTPKANKSRQLAA